MRIRLFNLFLIVAILAIVISSCKKPTGQAQRDLEQELLTKYIAKYHPTVTPKSSGLYFVETKAAPVGADTVKIGDEVKVFYRGYLIEDDATNGIQDGFKFDEMPVGYEPFTFTVGAGSVIAGWDEALTYMYAGSEAKIVVPSKLAYSSSAQTTIPAYSPLVFYITVYKISRPATWPVIQILPKTPIKR